MKIIQAVYGVVDPVSKTIKGFDVTADIVIGKKFGNKNVGEDPAPKKKKSILVKYEVEGVVKEKFFNENDVIQF